MTQKRHLKHIEYTSYANKCLENPCVGGSIPPRATTDTGLQPDNVLQNSITHSLHSFKMGIRCKTLHSMFI